MSLRYVSLSRLSVALAFTLLVGWAAAPAAAQDSYPKTDIFVGYSWWNPGETVNLVELDSVDRGFAISSAFNVNRWAAFMVDTDHHFGDNDLRYSTIMVGPRFMARREQLSPFAYGNVGWARLRVPGGSTSNGIGLAVGGGFDLHVHPRVSWRVIDAAYVWSHHNLFPDPAANFNGTRLRSGLVFNLGMGEPPPPPSAACSAQPSEVMAGEPVRVAASAANFKKGKTLTYTWKATGGQVEGQGEAVSVNTAGLAPGSYTVTANVAEGKNSAQCSASFNIKQPPPPPRNPPTMSCSANPTTVRSGDPSTISCNCSSPDGNPVSYQWRTSGGRVSGSGATVQLDTSGAPAGAITVNTTCSDDRGLTTSASTRVNVEVPPPPPQASKLNQIDFKRNSARVDNAAKAILDDVALRMQRDADARVVLVGNTAQGENQKIAAQRAINTKAYLTKEKGIDPSRIEVRTGSSGAMQTEIWWVPAGATFSGEGTQAVTEPAPRRR